MNSIDSPEAYIDRLIYKQAILHLRQLLHLHRRIKAATGGDFEFHGDGVELYTALYRPGPNGKIRVFEERIPYPK